MKSLFTLEASKGGLSRPQQDHQPHTEVAFTRILINPSVSFTCQLEVDFEVDKKSVTKEDEIELLLADEFGNKMVFDKTDI